MRQVLGSLTLRIISRMRSKNILHKAIRRNKRSRNKKIDLKPCKRLLRKIRMVPFRRWWNLLSISKSSRMHRTVTQICQLFQKSRATARNKTVRIPPILRRRCIQISNLKKARLLLVETNLNFWARLLIIKRNSILRVHSQEWVQTLWT